MVAFLGRFKARCMHLLYAHRFDVQILRGATMARCRLSVRHKSPRSASILAYGPLATLTGTKRGKSCAHFLCIFFLFVCYHFVISRCWLVVATLSCYPWLNNGTAAIQSRFHNLSSRWTCLFAIRTRFTYEGSVCEGGKKVAEFKEAVEVEADGSDTAKVAEDQKSITHPHDIKMIYKYHPAQ